MSAASLSLYQKKRKFSETPEPAGKVRRTGQERFSVQEHHARRLHYDLRLEMDGVLKSWAMPKGLPSEEGERRLAVMTEDHPVDYLDFEGIIPEGNYGAGWVVLWEIGTYQIVKGNLEEGKLTFTIFGRRHHGKFTLVRPNLQGDQNSWFIIKGGPAPFRKEAIRSLPPFHRCGRPWPTLPSPIRNGSASRSGTGSGRSPAFSAGGIKSKSICGDGT